MIIFNPLDIFRVLNLANICQRNFHRQNNRIYLGEDHFLSISQSVLAMDQDLIIKLPTFFSTVVSHKSSPLSHLCSFALMKREIDLWLTVWMYFHAQWLSWRSNFWGWMVNGHANSWDTCYAEIWCWWVDVQFAATLFLLLEFFQKLFGDRYWETIFRFIHSPFLIKVCLLLALKLK